MLNFQKLHYFCAMVEEGGIHKAARRLGLSQPPLSMALKELEAELGCQLVYRYARNWIVTDEGKRLYEEGRKILASMQDLPMRVCKASDGIRGTVRAGFSTSCVSMFHSVLPRLVEDHPYVRCDAMFTDSERLCAHVRQRMIDFAVAYLPVYGNEFAIIPLRSQKLVAIFSRLLASPPSGPLNLAQICEYPLLLPKRWSGGGIYAIFNKKVQALRLKPRIICQTQATYLLRDILDKIAAAAILPQCEAENSTRHEEREIAELAGEPLVPAIITLKNTYMPQAACAMLEMLRNEYGEN